MLILTRKIGEIIRIGDDVTIRVLGLRGGQVSLGFTAPNDVRIFREEVLLADRAAAAAAEPAAPESKRPVDRVVDGATREASAGPKRPQTARADATGRRSGTRPV